MRDEIKSVAIIFNYNTMKIEEQNKHAFVSSYYAPLSLWLDKWLNQDKKIFINVSLMHLVCGGGQHKAIIKHYEQTEYDGVIAREIQIRINIWIDHPTDECEMTAIDISIGWNACNKMTEMNPNN